MHAVIFSVFLSRSIGILRINAGHDQTKGPEDELNCRPEKRGFPVVLQDVVPDFFVAVLVDSRKQQFIFILESILIPSSVNANHRAITFPINDSAIKFARIIS